MKTAYTLDAWAILAYFQRELPAAEHVRALLQQASTGQVKLWMSYLNLGEVIYRIGRTRSLPEAENLWQQVHGLPLTLVPVEVQHILAAARIKAKHRLSYADAFAAALTTEMDATLLTGDPDFDALDIRIERLHRA